MNETLHKYEKHKSLEDEVWRGSEKSSLPSQPERPIWMEKSSLQISVRGQAQVAIEVRLQCGGSMGNCCLCVAIAIVSPQPSA